MSETNIDWPLEDFSGQLDEGFGSQDFIWARLGGLVVALKGWKRGASASAPREEIEERETVFRQWTLDALSFFYDLKASPWKAEFLTGSEEVRAHALRPLQGEYALYESVRLAPGSLYILDYIGEHNVFQTARYDMPTSLSFQKQVFVGDSRQEIAISINQLMGSLLDGGNLGLSPKSGQV